MGKFDLIDEIVDKGNGYLLTAQALDKGISRPTLAEYVKEHGMSRISRGIYLSEDAWPDVFYQVSLQYRKAVLSHESSLYLNGLMEREPRRITVTVPVGYNTMRMKEQGIRAYQSRPQYYNIGIVEIRTNAGNPVRAYDKERSICDMLRRKKGMDIQVFRYAMREYMTSRDKDLNRLMDYAQVFRIRDRVRQYTEVML